MGLLKPRPSPFSDLERELATLRSRQSMTSDRIAQARSAHETAVTKQRELLGAETFNTELLGSQNTKVAQAASIVAGLEGLASELAAAIEIAEANLADLHDQEARRKEAAAIDKTVGVIDTALATYVRGAQGLIAALAGQGGGITIEVGVQLATSLSETALQPVHDRVRDVLEAFKHARAEIFAGGPMPTRPVAVPPREVKPEIKRETVYLVSPVSWAEGEERHTFRPYCFVALPAEIAQFAVKEKLAVRRDDTAAIKRFEPLASTWDGTRPSYIDLNARLKATLAEVEELEVA